MAWGGRTCPQALVRYAPKQRDSKLVCTLDPSRWYESCPLIDKKHRHIKRKTSNDASKIHLQVTRVGVGFLLAVRFSYTTNSTGEKTRI